MKLVDIIYLIGMCLFFLLVVFLLLSRIHNPKEEITQEEITFEIILHFKEVDGYMIGYTDIGDIPPMVGYYKTNVCNQSSIEYDSEVCRYYGEDHIVRKDMLHTMMHIDFNLTKEELCNYSFDNSELIFKDGLNNTMSKVDLKYYGCDEQ